MEAHNSLGLYISRDSAVVVCIGGHGSHSKVEGCFSVSVAGQEETGSHALAGLIAKGCAEREWSSGNVTVALDCALFMQHSIHSEFTDPKRVAATVRFDTEDALATDSSDVAIAFQIACVNDGGSDLNVFTARKNVLSDILMALQSNGIDPVSIRPDVHCLSSFIEQKLSSGEGATGTTVFGMLSGRNGYLVIPPVDGEGKTQTPTTVRTFLLGATQNRSEVLQREVLMTTALARTLGPMSRLAVLDTKGDVDGGRLTERLGVEVTSIDISETTGDSIGDVDPVEFAVACGAALDSLDKYYEVNLRDDFMPFQGGRRRLENALKYFSIAVTILLVCVGLYFQMRLRVSNGENNDWQSKLASNYLAVMGQQLPTRTTVKTKLSSEINRLRAKKTGIRNPNEDSSLSSRLPLILDAVNKSAGTTGLQIEEITISAQSMSITGSTTNKNNTLRFQKALESNGLGDVSGNYSVKAGRDQFNLSIKPKK